MILTYKEWRTQIRKTIWPPPSGEPRNLVAAHDSFFQDAMARASKYIKCLQDSNTDVFPQCSTYVDCAMTVVEAPQGLIKRVYTIANDQWCDPVVYVPSSIGELRCWARHLVRNFTAPANSHLAEALPGGMRQAEPSTDIEGGRMRYGEYALHNGRLYVAPWIQSNERLVIEWKGRKTVWGDDDGVDIRDRYWNRDVRRYIELELELRHQSRFGHDQARKLELERDTADALAEAIHTCSKLQKLEDPGECANVPGYTPTSEEIEDDEVVDPPDMVTFAVIGDFGDPGNEPAPTLVADLVKSWSPDFIISTGDNIYSPTDTYEAAVGAYYGDYVKDTLGENLFWPAIGNHDHNDPANGIQDYYDYFTLPNNERYYDFVKGPVHFFVLHSGIQGNDQDDTEEPDGIQVGGAQAEWLRVRMALSKAKWKVVIVHDAPYTSGSGNAPGYSYLRWPYKDWGADVVLSGDSHGYERLLVDGLPYVVNGAGGRGLTTFPSPISESVLRHLEHGAMRCEAGCDTLSMKFYNTDGDLIDTLELERE